MEWFIPHFLSRSSWWVEENVFPEIHWPLYYSEKLDISIGDTENEGRVSCLLGQRKQDLKHVLLKTLQSYHGSRAQSHTNWNYWLGLWASYHNHFTCRTTWQQNEFTIHLEFVQRALPHTIAASIVFYSGVNICPKKSETVYPGIWGILKLSVLVNQKIFKTVYWNLKSTFFGQCWSLSSTLKK